MLMNGLFSEGVMDDEKESLIKNRLKEWKRGVDRIGGGVVDKEGVVIGDKRGWGDVNENGVVGGENDVGYICVGNNMSYRLGVFVKDLKGNEWEGWEYVGDIWGVVYCLLMESWVKC